MTRLAIALAGLLAAGCAEPLTATPTPTPDCPGMAPAEDVPDATDASHTADATDTTDAADIQTGTDVSPDGRTDGATDGGMDTPPDASPEVRADGAEDAGTVDEETGPTCPLFGEGEDTGAVVSGAIDEASGVVPATDPPGGYWIHNDSGGQPRIFRIGPSGEDLGQVEILEASNHDWEDIARCPSASGEGWDLVIGDMGDNGEVRETITLYRVTEPAVDATEEALVETVTLAYPDGPKDAEALICDPVTDTLYIVTKGSFGDTTTRVFRVPKTGPSPRILLDEGEIPLGSPATGADWHPDGSLVVVRTYIDAEVFERADDIFVPFESGCPVEVMIEPQGEAITWSPTGDALVTVSEGNQPTLWRYPKLP